MVRIYSEFEVSIRELAESLEKGGVIGLATDTTYALVAALSSRRGVEKLRELRKVPPSKNLSLLIKGLTQISKFAYIDRIGYRLVKRVTPGHYTFILKATKEVPRLTLTKQRTVGIRICGMPLIDAMCEAIGEPLISGSAVLPPNGYCETASAVAEKYPELDYVFDGGFCSANYSTVIDLTESNPIIQREGIGNIEGIF